MTNNAGPGSGRASGAFGVYVTALLLAAALGLAIALPVFAQEGESAAASSADGSTEEEQVLQPQVVGGEPVADGALPFMVSIQADTSDARPYREHFCGGSLIDADSVLTAAHCADLIGTAVSFRNIRLAIGVTELNSRQGTARRIASRADVRIHPLYDGRTYKYDAAVIELDAPVRQAPMVLAPQETGDALERPRTNAVVAGWGNTIKQGEDYSQPDRFPNRMRRATPPIVSDRKAERTYRGRYLSPVMVAAGQVGEDTCQGDSGGPMWVKTAEGKRQIGITSFGAGCGKRGLPGVYAEVNSPSVSAFIENASAD